MLICLYLEVEGKWFQREILNFMSKKATGNGKYLSKYESIVHLLSFLVCMADKNKIKLCRWFSRYIYQVLCFTCDCIVLTLIRLKYVYLSLTNDHQKYKI